MTDRPVKEIAMAPISGKATKPKPVSVPATSTTLATASGTQPRITRPSTKGASASPPKPRIIVLPELAPARPAIPTGTDTNHEVVTPPVRDDIEEPDQQNEDSAKPDSLGRDSFNRGIRLDSTLKGD